MLFQFCLWFWLDVSLFLYDLLLNHFIFDKIANFEFKSPSKDSIWYVAPSADTYNTPYSLTIDTASVAGQDFTLGLYSKRGFISSIEISKDQIQESNGYLEGNFDIAYDDVIVDGWYRLKLRGKGGWFGRSKTFAKTEKFKIVRLLDQPVKAKYNVVSYVDVDVKGFQLGEKDGLNVHVSFEPDTEVNRWLYFYLIDAETGKRVPGSKKSMKPAKYLDRTIIPMNMPEKKGKYYVEVRTPKNWFFKTTIFRSPLVGVLDGSDSASLERSFTGNSFEIPGDSKFAGMEQNLRDLEPSNRDFFMDEDIDAHVSDTKADKDNFFLSSNPIYEPEPISEKANSGYVSDFNDDSGFYDSFGSYDDSENYSDREADLSAQDTQEWYDVSSTPFSDSYAENEISGDRVEQFGQNFADDGDYFSDSKNDHGYYSDATEKHSQIYNNDIYDDDVFEKVDQYQKFGSDSGSGSFYPEDDDLPANDEHDKFGSFDESLSSEPKKKYQSYADIMKDYHLSRKPTYTYAPDANRPGYAYGATREGTREELESGDWITPRRRVKKFNRDFF